MAVTDTDAGVAAQSFGPCLPFPPECMSTQDISVSHLRTSFPLLKCTNYSIATMATDLRPLEYAPLDKGEIRLLYPST